MSNKVILAGALAFLAAPAVAQPERLAGNFWNQGGVVRVACFRGPLTLTAWDHPEGVFIESLVAVGYDYPSAWSIGDRICKDSALVGNPDALKAAMEEIIANAPRP